jgi:capsular polysaccharide biosynthesis protein
MELDQYWRIVWRRWWLVAAVVAVVLIASLATTDRPAPVYQASMRFAIGIEGQEPVTAVSGEGRSDAWLASEYLADDLSEVLKGGDFAARIGERVGLAVPAGAIFASREHRIMTVSITWNDRAQVQAIAEAVAAEVENVEGDYFPQLAGVEARAVLIDGPGIGEVGPGLRDRLDLPIRLLIALVAGVALTFLWDYLDDTVRSRAEVEALGVPLLAEIPRRPGLRWPGRRR